MILGMIFKNFQISAHNSHENGTFSGNAGLVIRGFIHPLTPLDPQTQNYPRVLGTTSPPQQARPKIL